MDVFTNFSEEDAPLNLSLKGRSRNLSIWSPGSLCEQEMKTLVDIRPDSSISASTLSPERLSESRWKWDQSENDCQGKLSTTGPSGEKTFTVSTCAAIIQTQFATKWISYDNTGNIMIFKQICFSNK